jgi:L-amino acid N-acyltransferase YncA
LTDGIAGEAVLGYNFRETFTIRGGLTKAIEVSVYVAAEYSTA